MRPPKRWKRDLPTCKPDWDNLAKSVIDALNNVFWRDDSLITDALVSKRYDWTTRQGSIAVHVETHEGKTV